MKFHPLPPSPWQRDTAGSRGLPGFRLYLNCLTQIKKKAIYINHAMRSFLKYFLSQIRRIKLQLIGAISQSAQQLQRICFLAAWCRVQP